jgi:formate-dependent nitrite reductase membrane component NrfD
MSEMVPPPLVEAPPPSAPDRGNIWAGFGLAAAINIGAAIVGIITVVIPFVIGVVQLAWIIPMVITFRRKGKTEMAKGIIIAAAITFLLNAGCWGLLLGNLGNMH